MKYLLAKNRTNSIQLTLLTPDSVTVVTEITGKVLGNEFLYPVGTNCNFQEKIFAVKKKTNWL